MYIIRKRPGILIFLLLAAMSTIIALMVYASVQQVYRNSANDPQIEAVQTISDVLDQGVPAEAITGQSDSVDMENSLSLFISIFDKDGKLVTSSGKLGEESPTPPSAVFDSARNSGHHRFTWQPKPGVSIAAVAQKLNNDQGFLIVGRNLKEINMRIQQTMVIVGAGWLVLLVLSALLPCVVCIRPRTNEPKEEQQENSEPPLPAS